MARQKGEAGGRQAVVAHSGACGRYRRAANSSSACGTQEVAENQECRARGMSARMPSSVAARDMFVTPSTAGTRHAMLIKCTERRENVSSVAATYR